MSDVVSQNDEAEVVTGTLVDQIPDRTEMVTEAFFRRAQALEVPINAEFHALFAPDQGVPAQRDDNFTYCPWQDAPD